MANFELTVDSASFRSKGVKAKFNENLYGELLEHALQSSGAEDYTPPQVYIAPHISWGKSLIKRVLTVHEINDVDSDYDMDEGMIRVACYSNPEVTNKLLRHETKHWSDAMTPSLEQGITWRKKATYSSVGSAAIIGGGTLGISLLEYNPPNTTLGSIGIAAGFVGASSGYWLSYLLSPHERAARAFANDSDIIARYSKVIECQEL